MRNYKTSLIGRDMGITVNSIKSSDLAASTQPWWFWLFLGTLLALPLPFGAARPWSSDLFGGGIAVALIGMAIDIYFQPNLWPHKAPNLRLLFVACLIGSVVLWGYIQTIAGIGPLSPLQQAAQVALKRPVLNTISMTPDRGLESLIRMLGYIGCFLIAFISGRNIGSARIILRWFVTVSFIYAVYGLLAQSTGHPTILWYPKWAYREFVTSTFVNKNSYATYVGIGLQVSLVLLWRELTKPPVLATPDQTTLDAWMNKIIKKDSKAIITSFVLLGALSLSGSRGGITATFIGCFSMFLAVAVNRRWSLQRWIGIFFCSLIIIMVFVFFGADVFIDRMDPTKLAQDVPLRYDAYKTTLAAISANPLTGYGLGSFVDVFRLFRDQSIQQWFEHAHNDYLEMALEIGIPATAALMLAIACLVLSCIKGVWTRKQNEVYSILAVGVTVQIMLHSLVDFSMQIPAIAATFVTLLGLGFAQSWSSRQTAR